jgi:hypothetical protein
MRKVNFTEDEIVLKEVKGDLEFQNDPSYYPKELTDSLLKIDFIYSIKKLYPNSKQWLEKVAKEIKNNDGPHRLFILKNSKTSALYGFFVIKDDGSKMKKICTIFVFNSYRNVGLGKVLLKNAVEVLNPQKDDIIYFTLAEGKLRRLMYFFMDNGFCYWERKRNFYKRDSLRNKINKRMSINPHLSDEHIFIYKNTTIPTYQ